MNDPDPAFRSQLALPKAELDFQLSPSQWSKDAMGILRDMGARTAAAMANDRIAVATDIPYGPRPRQRLDIFRPASGGANLPCLVFIHGGFWQEGDKSGSGFAAATFAAFGWATAAIGYTLTPEVSLREITDEITAALTFLRQDAARFGLDADRLIVTGHSAGAHLVASALAGLTGEGPSLAGAVLISGVFDLEPIARSYVSDLTPMTSEDIATLSPARSVPGQDTPVHLLIGADEADAFQVQSRVLRERWQDHLTTLTFEAASGRDHFDVLYELTNPESPAVRRILSMV